MTFESRATDKGAYTARPIRIGLVGCGAISERGYLPAARKVSNVQITLLVDSDLARAERLAKEFNIPHVLPDMDGVANEVEAIILATPPHVRPNLAERAFREGLHVLCEKPLANTAMECRAIISAAEQARRVLAVAHTYRYHPNRHHVFALMQQGELGAVRRVEIAEGGPADWPAATGYAFRRELIGGGVLLIVGVHTLDTLFWWFGSPLDFKYADDSIGGLESNVRIELRFAGETVADFRLSRTTTQSNRIAIRGDKGEVVLPIYDPSAVRIAIGGKVMNKKIASQSLRFADMVSEQLRDFAESIASGRPPLVTGADGMKVIEFIEQCYAAKRTRSLPGSAPIPGVVW